MPVITHTVTEAEAGRTVQSLALKELRLSRGMFSSLKFQNGILVDGVPAHADKRLSPGQTLTVRWQERTAAPVEPAPEVVFSIAYEDGNYLIIDKPAPLPTLSSAHQTGPTLENALFAKLGCPENYVFRPVNRLDKGTSGLMVVARHAYAQQRLQRQLHTADFVREYRAVAEGILPQPSGVIDLPIARTEDGVRREVRPDGQRAVTQYWVEGTFAGRSLVRLRLQTGRTHQIRVHLRALGCPIAGDYLYGTPSDTLSGRFALHACLVQFTHPFSGETVRRESPLPPDIAALLE